MRFMPMPLPVAVLLMMSSSVFAGCEQLAVDTSRGTVRDTAGLPLQFRMSFVSRETEGYTRVGYYALLFVSNRADLLSASQVLDTGSLDEYLQVRAAYRQKRWYDIHDGEPPEPDFFDDELFKE